MRWLFDAYLPIARRSQRELRSPMARLLVLAFCLVCTVWLVWLVIKVWWQHPTDDLRALAWLLIPILGAAYLLYVMGLVLFASGRRIKRGLISRPWLRILGYSLIPFGMWMLSQNRLDGAVSVVAGLACLGLARQRSDWSFGDDF